MILIFVICWLFSITKAEYLNVGKKVDGMVLSVHFDVEGIRYGMLHKGFFCIVSNAQGDFKTELIIQFPNASDPKRYLVGKAALYPLDTSSNATNTVIIDNVQQLIGKTFEQIQTLPNYPFNYQLVGRYNKPYIHLSDEIQLSIEELLGYFFQDIRTNVDSLMLESNEVANKAIKHMSLSLPDIYNDNDIMSIKAAVNKAGWQVYKTVKDSWAAAFSHYIFGIEDEKTILTIDITESWTLLTINTLTEISFEMLCQTKMDNFGNLNYSNVMREIVLGKYPDFAIDEMINTWDELVAFVIGHEVVDLGDGKEITRAEYQLALEPIVTYFVDRIGKVIKECDLRVVDEIVTIQPLNSQIQQRIKVWAKNINKVPTDIVYGLSIFTGAMQQSSDGINRIQPKITVTPICVEINYLMVECLIGEKTVIPISVKRRFTISRANQTKILLKVIEGSRPTSHSNQILGVLKMDVKPGSIYYDLEISIDNEGMIEASLYDSTQSKVQLHIYLDWLGLISAYQQSKQQSQNQYEERYGDRDHNFTVYSNVRKRVEPRAAEFIRHFETNSEAMNVISNEDQDRLVAISEEAINYFSKFAIEIEENTELFEQKFNETVFPILRKYFS